MAHEISYNNFEISLVVFMPNITTNHVITYTNSITDDLIPHANFLCTEVTNEFWEFHVFSVEFYNR